ncbi:MAG: CHC2 zinc finger domain-containing protein [Candidatus Cybelea sp.]|jgi:hypothetical protein
MRPVVERATALDVLQTAHIATVRRGARLWFRCPVHRPDNHPSCVIVGEDAKGWRCFACGARGGVLDLVVALGIADDRASAARWLEVNL